MSASSKRVKSFCDYFRRRRVPTRNNGPEKNPRMNSVKAFTPDEILIILKLAHNRQSELRDIVGYTRTCKASSSQLSIEEIREAFELFHVRDVLES